MLILAAGCMEGQKPTPLLRTPGGSGNAAGDTLYKRLGGKSGIVKVVDDFVAEVARDDRIRAEHKKHFKEGDVAGLKDHLVNQLGSASGGPEKYKGRPMDVAHKGLKITNKDFDALVDDLVLAMRRNAVPVKEQEEVKKLLEPLRKEVVEVP
jgi:hemoglobin